MMPLRITHQANAASVRGSAHKTWLLGLLTTIGAVTETGTQDPWPFWQRTADRQGNTETIGPRRPTLDWSASYTTEPDPTVSAPTVVLNRFGSIIAGSPQGVAVLDFVTHEMVWEQITSDTSGRPATARDRIIIGSSPVPARGHCFDVFTGDTIWSRPAVNIGSAPVIHNGVVYISDQGTREILALDLENGSLIWSTPTEDAMYDSPTLDCPTILTSAGELDASTLSGLVPASGERQWAFDTGREIFGHSVIHTRAIYMASTDRWLYAIDRDIGEELWRFWTEQFNRGSVAVAHDGTIVTGTSGNIGLLFAVTPNGEQLWRYEMPGDIANSPIIDGENRIYVTSSHWTGHSYEARVHAFRSDGTEQWSMLMPDDCRASPTLGPDGTLYILCRDHNLYAFRDPHTTASLTDLEVTTGDILEGGINDLDEVDDNLLRIRSGFGQRLSDLHNMELSLSATVDDPDFDILRIQIKTRIDQPTGVGTVQLKNWITGEFETVRTYILEDKPFYEWIQIPKGGNNEPIDPHRYVRLSGAIEMKMKNIVFVPFLAFTFETEIDQVKIEVN